MNCLKCKVGYMKRRCFIDVINVILMMKVVMMLC